MELGSTPEMVLSDLEEYYDNQEYISVLFNNVTSKSPRQSLKQKSMYFSKISNFLCNITDHNLKIQYMYLLVIIIRREYKEIKALTSDDDKMKHSMFLQDCLIQAIIESCFTIGPIDYLQQLFNKIILTAIKIKICLRQKDFSVFEPIPNQIMHHMIMKIYPLDTQLLKISKKLLFVGFIDDETENGKDFSFKLALYIKELFTDENYKTVSITHIISCIDIISNYYSKTEFLRAMFEDDFSCIINGLVDCMQLSSARVQPKYEKLQNIAFTLFLEIKSLLEPIELLRILRLISNKWIIIECYSENMHEFLKAMISDFYPDFCLSIWKAYINIAYVNDVTAIDFMIFFMEHCQGLEEETVSELLNLFSSILDAIERWIIMFIQKGEEEDSILSGDFIQTFIECVFHYIEYNQNNILDLFDDDDVIDDFMEDLKYLHSLFGFDLFVEKYIYLQSLEQEE